MPPPRFVDVRVTRHLKHPVDQAYAWLTDYQDDDPARTDAVVRRRPVLERHPDRVVMEGELEILGRRAKGKVEVRLFPPDRWEARILEGSGRGSVYEYRLSPEGTGSRLDVRYRIGVRRWSGWLKVVLARPAVKRDLRRMWEGFEGAMERELALAVTPSDARA